VAPARPPAKCATGSSWGIAYASELLSGELVLVEVGEFLVRCLVADFGAFDDGPEPRLVLGYLPDFLH
jgi:hypothetical protein